MARTLTPVEAYQIVNALVKQATGQQSVTVSDISSFVSAGELIMSTGTENVINSLNIVLARTLVASRPYEAKLKLMDQLDTGLYSSRLRKISYYSKDAQPSGAFNTDQYLNLADGFTNGENDEGTGAQSTKSMWEQNPPVVLEMNFAGSATYQTSYTIYEAQLQAAFESPEAFSRFVSGYLQEHANDIASQKESWNRMALLQKIGSVYHMQGVMPGSVINLTAEYNAKFGTSYTSEQLRTTYLADFLKFFVAEFKLVSKYMTERSLNYHWSPAKQVKGVDYNLLRHTPYASQHVYLYAPLFTEAEAQVLPEIFNPEYLDINTQYEEVTYWQGIEDRAAVNVVPAITDTSDGTQKAGSQVALEYVVGMITDKDGLMTNFQFERSASSPLEARKLYRTVWETYMKGIVSDNTENCVLFIMAD